ncbi:response regulator transcription factor [Niastella caeni]|uniref:Response regulator transcription factor n=1 Tax=Niastella caeni TaxID=2569763 RepID=A0A4S8HTD5_9BACT|nr:LytTR family DNA-binding domain-containing protein [Niastella caeni]THU38291.1 response regulator transcription factor [Niastella caeni]
MIQCNIIDDEPKNITILKELLNQYCPHVTVKAEATNATEAIQVIRKTQPHLVFMDIEMPETNAFGLLNQLLPINFETIFVTAYETYAFQAFKYSALDYLLKPIDIDDLTIAVEKAVTRIREKNTNRKPDFFHNQLPGYTFSKIALSTADGLTFYPIADIVCCKAKGACTQVDFVKDKSLTTAGTLKEFEEMLPADVFCRVHHSYLVNLNYIKKYYRGKGGYIELINGQTIEVSQRKRDEFLGRLGH